MALAACSNADLAALTDREFERLRVLIYDATGITLAESKQQMMYRRLAGRVRELGLASFNAYCDHLQSGDPAEIEILANAITTNLTYFFREKHHFDYLEKTLAQRLIEQHRGEKRLRIWSAGCSSGEEPYSIAISLREAIPDLDRWDVKILATDLDSQMLSRCESGVYSTEQVEKLAQDRVERWFLKGLGANEGSVRARPQIRSLIIFKRLNLMGAWPMKGRFDVIFCRNVMIYFDKTTQATLVDRFANATADDGHLIVGHSESLFNITERFALVEKTVYRKIR